MLLCRIPSESGRETVRVWHVPRNFLVSWTLLTMQYLVLKNFNTHLLFSHWATLINNFWQENEDNRSRGRCLDYYDLQKKVEQLQQETRRWSPLLRKLDFIPSFCGVHPRPNRRLLEHRQCYRFWSTCRRFWEGRRSRRCGGTGDSWAWSWEHGER